MLQDLPELVLDSVCDHLSYEDVLTLRSTCKGLKRFVDGMKFTKLNLFIRKFWYHHRLYHTDEPIGYAHSYHSPDPTILNSSRFRQQFVNVKQMVICSGGNYSGNRKIKKKFDLNFLNCFFALEQLELYEIYGINGKLSLQKLRIATFRGCSQSKEPDSSIELNCPRLSILRICQFKPALTSATNQLECLYYDYYDDPRDYLESISPNLRKLSTICFKSTASLSLFLSSLQTGSLSLPSLDLLKMQEFNGGLGGLDELANNLEILNRDPVKKPITLISEGRRMRSLGELREIARLVRSYDSQADNEHLLSYKFLNDHTLLFLNGDPELSFLLSLACAAELSKNTELNEEIISKLKGIESLELSDQCKPSQSMLEHIVRTCKTLCSLYLSDQKLTKRLLETMAKHLVNLSHLRIWQCQCETLKPLAKFQNLEFIEMDLHPTKDELTFIYERSRSLESVRILCKNLIELMRTITVPNVCKIFKYEFRQTIEFENLQTMIEGYIKEPFEKIEHTKRDRWGKIEFGWKCK